MGMGFAPTWLRQVSPLLYMTTLNTLLVISETVFPVNHLNWYWQPNKNNQVTEHTNNIKITQPKKSH